LADNLLAENEQRFIGYKKRSRFLASIAYREGEMRDATNQLRAAIDSEPLNWTNYSALGTLKLRNGKLAEAADLFLSFPPFKDQEIRNKVSLSHSAYRAGMSLLNRGGVDEALPLLKLASEYKTGSASSLSAEALLDKIDGQYAASAMTYKRVAKRYGKASSYIEYIKFLFSFGYHDLGWALFHSLKTRYPGVIFWGSALSGIKSGGWSDAQIRELLNKRKTKVLSQENRAVVAINGLLVDRRPNQEALDFIESLLTVPELRTSASGGVELFQPPLKKWTKIGPDKFISYISETVGDIKAAKHDLFYFAKGYVALKNKNYKKARDVFVDRAKYYSTGSPSFNYALSYLVRSSIKSGDAKSVGLYLSAMDSHKQGYHYYISMAYFSASEGKHKEAIAFLSKAVNQPPKPGTFILDSIYSIIEASEWLYEDSKEEAYRDFFLKHAIQHQRANPTTAWPYAVEAKYSQSPLARHRALAFALYLDPRSQRIEHFHEQDKQKARIWMKSNNPFTERRPDEASLSI